MFEKRNIIAIVVLKIKCKFYSCYSTFSLGFIVTLPTI